VGNILRRHGIAPAPKRNQTTTWKEFIRWHIDALAGTDFFTVEVLTWRGLVTYYVLFFLHLETRRVSLASVTRHPTEAWMTQMARNAVDEESIKGNLLLFPSPVKAMTRQSIRCRERLGGLLRYYSRAA
jgi:hypothetical protein